jgi:hypothetical protein
MKNDPHPAVGRPGAHLLDRGAGYLILLLAGAMTLVHGRLLVLDQSSGPVGGAKIFPFAA